MTVRFRNKEVSFEFKKLFIEIANKGQVIISLRFKIKITNIKFKGLIQPSQCTHSKEI